MYTPPTAPCQHLESDVLGDGRVICKSCAVLISAIPKAFWQCQFCNLSQASNLAFCEGPSCGACRDPRKPGIVTMTKYQREELTFDWNLLLGLTSTSKILWGKACNADLLAMAVFPVLIQQKRGGPIEWTEAFRRFREEFGIPQSARTDNKTYKSLVDSVMAKSSGRSTHLKKEDRTAIAEGIHKLKNDEAFWKSHFVSLDKVARGHEHPAPVATPGLSLEETKLKWLLERKVVKPMALGMQARRAKGRSVEDGIETNGILNVRIEAPAQPPAQRVLQDARSTPVDSARRPHRKSYATRCAQQILQRHSLTSPRPT